VPEEPVLAEVECRVSPVESTKMRRDVRMPWPLGPAPPDPAGRQSPSPWAAVHRSERRGEGRWQASVSRRQPWYRQGGWSDGTTLPFPTARAAMAAGIEARTVPAESRASRR
jgi:hypothetical protein